MGDSIYGPAPRTSSATLHTPTTIASSCDAHLAGILDAPMRPARRERELAVAFAALTIVDRRALHVRLTNPKPGDALAAKLGRLSAERRTRLVNLLDGGTEL